MREYSVRGYSLSFEAMGKIQKFTDVYFTPSKYTTLRISNIFYTAATGRNNYKNIFLRWFFRPSFRVLIKFFSSTLLPFLAP